MKNERKKKMPVYVSAVDSYQENRIKEEVVKALDDLNISLKGKKTAFLKPNIVVPASPDSTVITHPTIVEAVIEVLREGGIERIVVGEGVGVGQDVKACFEKSGYRELCERLNVELSDLDKEERLEVDWKFGKLKLPKVVLESDFYVNLAKMKTHGQSMVTLSMKNQKGLLLPQDKRNFHVRWGLHEPIVELAKVVKPDIVVVDGIEGMEGEGPLKGKKKKPGALIFGNNQLEVDATCCQIMNIPPEKVEHLRIGEERGIGKLNPKIIGEEINKVSTPFQEANQEFGHVLNIYSWRNPYACSMCIQNFSEAIKMAVLKPRYWYKIPKLAYYTLWSKLHLIQGRDACLPDQKGRIICMGKCTKEIAESHGYTHIEGCPPKPRDILEKL
ncbi:DUF362 domain-containing protein [Candidatus Altiarchaeota archaeon]